MRYNIPVATFGTDGYIKISAKAKKFFKGYNYVHFYYDYKERILTLEMTKNKDIDSRRVENYKPDRLLRIYAIPLFKIIRPNYKEKSARYPIFLKDKNKVIIDLKKDLTNKK